MNELYKITLTQYYDKICIYHILVHFCLMVWRFGRSGWEVGICAKDCYVTKNSSVCNKVNRNHVSQTQTFNVLSKMAMVGNNQ